MINFPPLVSTRVLTFLLLSFSAAASEWLDGENILEPLRKFTLNFLEKHTDQLDKSVESQFAVFAGQLSILCYTRLDDFRYGFIVQLVEPIGESVAGERPRALSVITTESAEPTYCHTEDLQTYSKKNENYNTEDLETNSEDNGNDKTETVEANSENNDDDNTKALETNSKKDENDNAEDLETNPENNEKDNAEALETNSENNENDTIENIKEDDKVGKEEERLQSDAVTLLEKTDSTRPVAHLLRNLFSCVVDSNFKDPEEFNFVSSGPLHKGPVVQAVTDAVKGVIAKVGNDFNVKFDKIKWIELIGATKEQIEETIERLCISSFGILDEGGTSVLIGQGENGWVVVYQEEQQTRLTQVGHRAVAIQSIFSNGQHQVQQSFESNVFFDNTDEVKRSIESYEDQYSPMIKTNDLEESHQERLLEELKLAFSFRNRSEEEVGMQEFDLMGNFGPAVQDNSYLQQNFQFYEQTYEKSRNWLAYVVTVMESGNFLKFLGPFLNFIDAQNALRSYKKEHMPWILAEMMTSSSGSSSQQSSLNTKTYNGVLTELVTREIQKLINGSKANLKESGSVARSTSLLNSLDLDIRLMRSSEISIPSDAGGSEDVVVQLYVVSEEKLSKRYAVAFFHKLPPTSSSKTPEAVRIYPKFFQEENCLCSTETTTFMRWYKECSTKKLRLKQTPAIVEADQGREIKVYVNRLTVLFPPNGTTNNTTLESTVMDNLGIFTLKRRNKLGLLVIHNFVVIRTSFFERPEWFTDSTIPHVPPVPLLSAYIVVSLMTNQNPKTIPIFLTTVDDATDLMEESYSGTISVDQLPNNAGIDYNAVRAQIENELCLLKLPFIQTPEVMLHAVITSNDNVDVTDPNIVTNIACKLLWNTPNRFAYVTVIVDLAQGNLVAICEVETSLDNMFRHWSTMVLSWNTPSELQLKEKKISERIGNCITQILETKKVKETTLLQLNEPATDQQPSSSASSPNLENSTPLVKIQQNSTLFHSAWAWTPIMISHYTYPNEFVTLVIFELRYDKAFDSYVAMAYRSRSKPFTLLWDGDTAYELNFTRCFFTLSSLLRLPKSDYAKLQGVKSTHEAMLWQDQAFSLIPFAKEINENLDDFARTAKYFVERSIQCYPTNTIPWKFGVVGDIHNNVPLLMFQLTWERCHVGYVVMGLLPATASTDEVHLSPNIVPRVFKCPEDGADYVLNNPFTVLNSPVSS